MRDGELERFLRLAASREGIEEIILLVDLDDGCPVEFAENFNGRAAQIATVTGKLVHICFCVREYEAWFLADIENLRLSCPEFGIRDDASFAHPESHRPAKELLKSVCSRGYKQMRDQVILTKKLDVKGLVRTDRSFRKLAKAVTRMDYEQLLEMSSA